VYAHGRSDAPLTIPLPTVQLEAGDRVAVVVDQERVGAVQETFDTAA
jgi:trk system potassium uptake protein TrkA